MKILDLDMDYFMDVPVDNKKLENINKRVSEECYVNSVWQEQRVRSFLENNLGLSLNTKIPGRVVKEHYEALFFWEELIKKGRLRTPFSVVHVDSHADLGYRTIEKRHILDEMLFWEADIREKNIRNELEMNGYYCKVNSENYLLYAIAYRWLSDLVYCGNENKDSGDVPEEIVIDSLEEFDSVKEYKTAIKLQPSDKSKGDFNKEPIISFTIKPKTNQVRYDDFDYAILAQSPGFTPQNADYIMDVFKEYIYEI